MWDPFMPITLNTNLQSTAVMLIIKIIILLRSCNHIDLTQLHWNGCVL